MVEYIGLMEIKGTYWKEKALRGLQNYEKMYP